MKKLAILSTFVFAFGVAMLVTAPTADAQPCACVIDSDGDGTPDTERCCTAADPTDPAGTAGNAVGALGGGDGTQVTCGAVYVDDDNFVAGRIGGGEPNGTAGCISVAGQNTNQVIPGDDPEECKEDAVAACHRGGCTHEGGACTP